LLELRIICRELRLIFSVLATKSVKEILGD